MPIELVATIEDTIRESIIDLLNSGEARGMILDHLGSEEARKEVDRHIREAVDSNEVASNEFRAIEAKIEEEKATNDRRCKFFNQRVEALRGADGVISADLAKLEVQNAAIERRYDDLAKANGTLAAQVADVLCRVDRMEKRTGAIWIELGELFGRVTALEAPQPAWRRLLGRLRAKGGDS
jgi:hypothetical protein